MQGATTLTTGTSDAEVRAVADLMDRVASRHPLPQAAEASAEVAAIVERSGLSPEACAMARAHARRLKEQVEVRAVARIRARQFS